MINGFDPLPNNGTWTAPQMLAELPGKDEAVSLASDSDGEITAVWLNNSENSVTLFSSVWNGSNWSTPVAVTNAVLIDPPVIAYSSGKPVAVWSQDTDKNIDTFNDWKLYSSSYDGSEWSSPAVINISESSASTARAKGRMQSRSSDTPPQECCCQEGDESEECKDDESEPPEPPKEPVDESSSEVVVPRDPNEKVAPLGTGEKHYVNPGDRLTYTVYFENKSDAKAPAQEVFIEDYLDNSLDYTTLRVENYSFGNILVANPKDGFVFNTGETIADYRADVSKQWRVDMSDTFDGNTGLLKFTFRTIDPETEDLPEDALAGFLPPEDGTGRGQGYVVFSVETKKELAPGTVIKNKASIVFDTNAPIVTNEAFNTIFEPDEDKCPSDPNKTEPGICGCGVSDTDTDKDGTPDCNDKCPNDASKINAGSCGCGVPDTDTDKDGTPDCNDKCPNDPKKITPGKCGCGVTDTDTDKDGTPDCNDKCPNDSSKINAGVCGCGVSDTDTDKDGTPDCKDNCLSDPEKTTPGKCGCGIAETESCGTSDSDDSQGGDNCFISTVAN